MAIQEPMTEPCPPAATVVACPLCSDRFTRPAHYQAHLAQVHDLVDDAGTDTVAEVTPPPPPVLEPEPAAPPTKAEARALAKEAKESKASAARAASARIVKAKAAAKGRSPRPSRSRAARPARAARPNRLPRASLRSQLRLPAVDAGGRYPLALRYGDIALYVPGALLVLAGVLGRGSDVVSVTMAIFGAVLVLTGMLLPLLHHTFFATPAPTQDAPVEVPEPVPTLEEALLSLPPKR